MNQEQKAAAFQLISDRVVSAGASDRFPLMQVIKDAAKQLKAQFPLEVVLAAADEAYDKFIGPIDLPGPDIILDRLAKLALAEGIKRAYELLD
jgi:hypothetical protein